MSLKIVNELKPVTYKYNEQIKNDDKVHMGFIAQDLLELFGGEYAIVHKDKNSEYLMIKPDELIAPIVKALQQLSDKVTELELKLKIITGD